MQYRRRILSIKCNSFRGGEGVDSFGGFGVGDSIDSGYGGGFLFLWMLEEDRQKPLLFGGIGGVRVGQVFKYQDVFGGKSKPLKIEGNLAG